MARFVYVGSEDPAEDQVTTVFGQDFPKGVPVEVTDANAADRLGKNGMFEAVKGRAKPSEPAE